MYKSFDQSSDILNECYTGKIDIKMHSDKYMCKDVCCMFYRALAFLKCSNQYVCFSIHQVDDKIHQKNQDYSMINMSTMLSEDILLTRDEKILSVQSSSLDDVIHENTFICVQHNHIDDHKNQMHNINTKINFIASLHDDTSLRFKYFLESEKTFVISTLYNDAVHDDSATKQFWTSLITCPVENNALRFQIKSYLNSTIFIKNLKKSNLEKSYNIKLNSTIVFNIQFKKNSSMLVKPNSKNEVFKYENNMNIMHDSNDYKYKPLEKNEQSQSICKFTDNSNVLYNCEDNLLIIDIPKSHIKSVEIIQQHYSIHVAITHD